MKVYVDDTKLENQILLMHTLYFPRRTRYEIRKTREAVLKTIKNAVLLSGSVVAFFFGPHRMSVYVPYLLTLVACP